MKKREADALAARVRVFGAGCRAYIWQQWTPWFLCGFEGVKVLCAPLFVDASFVFFPVQVAQLEATTVHVVREVDFLRIPRYCFGPDGPIMSGIHHHTVPQDFADLSTAIAVQV